jgi:hypothetical protein
MEHSDSESLTWIENITFDSNEDLLLLQGREKLQVLDFSQNKDDNYKSQIVQTFNLSSIPIYEAIYDARIETDSCVVK